MDRRTGRFDHRIHTPGSSFRIYFIQLEQDHLSDSVGRSAFRIFRRWPSVLSMAGPLCLVMVILCWVLMIAIGFALIYWAGFPDNFRLSDPAIRTAHPFWLMFYFSLEVMTTLGLGDLIPTTDWLRILATGEALIGFSLVTASVSWIVLLYPALGRMRTLARRALILVNAEQSTGVQVISGDVERLLTPVTTETARVNRSNDQSKPISPIRGMLPAFVR